MAICLIFVDVNWLFEHASIPKIWSKITLEFRIIEIAGDNLCSQAILPGICEKSKQHNKEQTET